MFYRTKDAPNVFGYSLLTGLSRQKNKQTKKQEKVKANKTTKNFPSAELCAAQP